MKFASFLKEILLDGRRGLLRFRTDRQNLPPVLLERIDRKSTVTNVRRIVPFSILIFLIEICNLLTIFLTSANFSLNMAYLLVGTAILLLMAGAVIAAYRLLCRPKADIGRCKLFYRCFWGVFTVVMLFYVYLEVLSRGTTNNFIYLLILTAAFPLLSCAEALCLFGFDALVMILAALNNGISAQQLLQLPLITVFAVILSRVLYNSHCLNEITLEQLEVSNRKLVSLAQTDPLTGLLNRRGVQERLQEQLLQAELPCEVAFLMVDIDLFKSYNDRFGHGQGDLCLQKVADALKRCALNTTEFAARIGGEEFLVVLIGCDAGAMLRTAQRLRQEVLDLSLLAAVDTVNRYVTVSVGIAAAQVPFEFTALYDQADKALYLAKNSGRNCVALNGSVCRGER